MPIKKKTKKVKKKTKKVTKKTTTAKSKKVIDLMCANSYCTAWLHPVNVPYRIDISFYKCPRCGESMKKYSAKVAEDDKRRVKGMMYKKLHDENAAQVTRLRESSQSKTYSPSSTYSTSSGTSSNYNKSSTEKGAYDKFLDGSLDLATAFWLFGVIGSFVVSLGLTLLAEFASKIFYIPFVIVNAGIIACLWECAENYKKEKLQKKQSAVWGYLTQVFCVVAGLGLISTILDIFKTL